MLGIVIVALNEPVFVEITLDGLVVITLMSNFIVIDVLLAKLFPDTITTVPGGPELGDNVIPVTMTVNVIDSVFVPSVADIIWLPCIAFVGIVVVVENVPVLVEVAVVNGVVSNFIVIVLLAPKLEPEIVTVVPVGPEVGDKVIAVCGAVTVNVTLLEKIAP